MHSTVTADLWTELKSEAADVAVREPLLSPLLVRHVSSQPHILAAVANLIAEKVACSDIAYPSFRDLFQTINIDAAAVTRDLAATLTHDPAATSPLLPFLFFKGFHALLLHRYAHALWNSDRQEIALLLQSRGSQLFGVDIHPAARIGSGIMMDHATGIVIGETAVVEDDVLFWHGVTLGGRAREKKDRHPKIRRGVVLGAGATLLGNIEIGAGAKIAAGATVIRDVEAGATYAGPLAVKI